MTFVGNCWRLGLPNLCLIVYEVVSHVKLANSHARVDNTPHQCTSIILFLLVVKVGRMCDFCSTVTDKLTVAAVLLYGGNYA